jgi:hypothetical protein
MKIDILSKKQSQNTTASSIFALCPSTKPSSDIHLFSMALPANSGPRPLIQFRKHFSQTVGLLRRVISPSQGRYLNTGQHKTQNKRIHTPNIHTLSGIRTHDPSVRMREDSSCLRPGGYCDRLRQPLESTKQK